MQNSQRIQAFSVLGNNLESFIQDFNNENPSAAQAEFNQKIYLAQSHNAWFDVDNQLFAIDSWAKSLRVDNLNHWLNKYNQPAIKNKKNIGIVTAGNIPMVGFHDILTVILSGNKAQVKLSSHDKILIPYIFDLLIGIEPKFKNQIEFVEKLTNYDAVIATGSDNTARYFENYFQNVPHLIRKNRTSVAVLNGDETQEELQGLAQDMLQYYGMGCRNVTKLYLPYNYDLNQIFKPLFPWKNVINHHKYANNYDYYKAIFLMKNDPIVENGFLLMKEDKGLFSPISTIYYEYYSDESDVLNHLKNVADQIQCVVGNGQNQVPFGKAQSPELWDYADGVDTMQWLINLS